MNKAMKVLYTYRILCEMYACNGRAVGSSELMDAVNFQNNFGSISQGTFYGYIKALMNLGFVVRVARGWYVPVDIYQMHMDDYINE